MLTSLVPAFDGNPWFFPPKHVELGICAFVLTQPPCCDRWRPYPGHEQPRSSCLARATRQPSTPAVLPAVVMVCAQVSHQLDSSLLFHFMSALRASRVVMLSAPFQKTKSLFRAALSPVETVLTALTTFLTPSTWHQLCVQISR